MLDAEQFAAMRDVKGWTIVALFLFCGILLCSVVPGTSVFFATEFAPVFALWCLMIALALLDGNPWIQSRVGPEGKAILLLLGSGGLQLLLWGLVVFSSVTGGTVLVAFPVLLASYHGQHFQVSLAYPYGGLVTLAAVLISAGFDTDGSHLALLIVGGLLSLGASGVMGDNERRRQLALKERDALRDALDAQLLLEKSSEFESVQRTLKELRGANHDAANTLSSMLVNTQYLIKSIKKVDGQAQLSEQIQASAQDLEGALTQLRRIIERGRKVGNASEAGEVVVVEEVIESAIAHVVTTHPGIRVEVDVPQTPTYLVLPNGKTTLYRMLTNLLVNACEGDGRRKATAVHVAVDVDDEVVIAVSDDGPGFAQEQLTAPVAALSSTKPTGSGLGLYTTQRLAAACGAALERANREPVGARVTLRFALAQ